MKQFKLPKEFAEKWIAALRSGEYEQGGDYLMFEYPDDEEYKSYIKGMFEITHSEPEYEDLGEFPESSKGWCRNFKGFIPYRYIIETK